MENSGNKGFILNTKFYKNPNYVSLLDPKKWKPEGKASIKPEGN